MRKTIFLCLFFSLFFLNAKPIFSVDLDCLNNFNRTNQPPLTYDFNGKPFETRAQLDQYLIEESKQLMPELNGLSLPPQTVEEADRIRQIREKPSNWPTICGVRAKTFEVIIHESALAKFREKKSQFGGATVEEVINAHFAEVNRILATAPNFFDRLAYLKRILVVKDSVVSGPQPGGCDDLDPSNTNNPIPNSGWQVCNMKSYSWWANDFLNSVIGTIPYDIDGRWVITDHWLDHVLDWVEPAPQPLFGKDFRIDYALVHEVLHQFGLGDLYWNNPGIFGTFQSRGKILLFDGGMNENDSMQIPHAANLSPLSTMAGRFFYSHNPKLARPGPCGECQWGNDGYVDPYTQSPARAEIIIDYGPLAGKVTNCYLGRRGEEGAYDFKMVEQVTGFPVENSSTSCRVTFSGNYLERFFPGFFIVLEIPYANLGIEDDLVLSFPLFFERPVLNSMVWGGMKENGVLRASLSEISPLVFADVAEQIRKGERYIYLDRPHGSYSNYQEYADRLPLPPERIAKEGVFLQMPFPGSEGGLVIAYNRTGELFPVFDHPLGASPSLAPADNVCSCNGENKAKREKGDYDCSGTTDLLDYNTWFNGYVRGASPDEDYNCSNGAGIDDFNVWIANR